MRKKSAENISMYAVYVALAFILSYIEALFPLPAGIPGVKPGFANIITVYIIYTANNTSAVFTVSLLRVILVACTFGNMSMFMYSLCGAMLSSAVMCILYKTKLFTAYGISIAGGVFHNAGQLIVAGFILETSQLIYYMPILMFSGMAAGFVVGYIAVICIRRLNRTNQQ